METEVAIIGSGIAGSAAAHMLSLQKRDVVLIERQFSEPDRIVGELLQPGGVGALRNLGLGGCVEGIDAAIVHGYIVHNTMSGENVPLAYPREESCNAIITGRAFHHGRFVMKLREAALKSERVTKVEGSATELIYEKGVVAGVVVKTKDENDLIVRAKLTIVADGCFSKFRDELSGSKKEVWSHFVGIIMEDCPQFKTNFAEVVLSQGGVVLIYKISEHSTRALIDIKGPMPTNLRSHILQHIAPYMPPHMSSPFNKAVESGRIRFMPNSFLASGPKCIPGVIMLGDASNMRHPLTGAGMSTALNDILLWRDLLQGVDLSDHALVISALEKFHWDRKSNHSFVINILAQALYSVFSATDVNMKFIQQSCFKYFQLGGECTQGPVSLLSILTPKPSKLITHFFAVALYAMYNALVAHGVLMFPVGIYRSCMVIFTASKLIFPLIWSETAKPIK